jgi:hypothetical protein
MRRETHADLTISSNWKPGLKGLPPPPDTMA